MHNRQQQLLMEAGARLGLEVVDLQPMTGMDLIRFVRGGRSALVLDGHAYPNSSSIGEFICWNKHATKAFLAEQGLATPEGLLLTDVAAAHSRIAAFVREHGPSVLKPNEGTEGDGVLMAVSDADTAVAHARAFASYQGAWLLEEQLVGHDLRMHCIDGVVAAACVREPAFVIGDGAHTLMALIEQRRALMSRQNPANRLDIDHLTEVLLAEQRVALEDVPATGRKIRLKRVANMSQGAVSTDVTDTLHPRWHEYAHVVTNMVHIGIFALDAITRDIAADPDEPATHARILEVNGRADWLHHTFSEGRQHDMASMILRALLAC